MGLSAVAIAALRERKHEQRHSNSRCGGSFSRGCAGDSDVQNEEKGSALKRKGRQLSPTAWLGGAAGQAARSQAEIWSGSRGCALRSCRSIAAVCSLRLRRKFRLSKSLGLTSLRFSRSRRDCFRASSRSAFGTWRIWALPGHFQDTAKQETVKMPQLCTFSIQGVTEHVGDTLLPVLRLS